MRSNLWTGRLCHDNPFPANPLYRPCSFVDHYGIRVAVLVDTGLRPRHGGFTAAADLAAATGAGMQWAQALTEAIILDWCASPWPGQQQHAAKTAAAHRRGEKGVATGQQLVAGVVDTAWMDSAMQQGAANPGRIVITNAVLLRWLQSKTARS